MLAYYRAAATASQWEEMAAGSKDAHYHTDLDSTKTASSFEVVDNTTAAVVRIEHPWVYTKVATALQSG